MKILGFGAHPDDAEIFFLGTLLAFKAAGHEIGWVVASDGAKGGPDPGPALARLREGEAVAAGAPHGVTPVFLRRPDGGLSEDARLRAAVETVLLAEAPDLVLTHAPEDYHPDHRALSRAVGDAASFRAPVLYADTLNGVGFQPLYYVDITPHMAAKQAAIRCHESQRPERFVTAATALNRLRAVQCNAVEEEAYAEAFRFEPRAPFADPRGLLPPPPPVRPLGTLLLRPYRCD